MLKLKLYLKQIRIHHWIKNLLLFLPLVFAKKFDQIEACSLVLLGFFCFCLVSSVIYIINDIFDKKKDCLHPQKKLRPIASKAISQKNALILALFFLVNAFFLSYFLPPLFKIILSLYFFLNLLYSIKLKHIVVLDFILIACMYLIRIYAGAAILDLVVTDLVLLTSFFGSLFLITSKRYSEFLQNSSSREILKSYNKELLEFFIGISVSLTLVFYVIYALKKSSHFVLTIPIVLFGLLRYVYLVFFCGKGEEPEKHLFDFQILLSIGLWFLVSMIIISNLP